MTAPEDAILDRPTPGSPTTSAPTSTPAVRRTVKTRPALSDPEPTDDQLRAFYQQHIAQFTDPEQRRASHISKGVSRMASREGLLDEFAAVREQLMDGADFETLARAHSDRGSDLVDLGHFRRGDLPEEVELVAFTMRVGETSPVFSSSVGIADVAVLASRLPVAGIACGLRGSCRWAAGRRASRRPRL